jgi:hypothetical protein
MAQRRRGLDSLTAGLLAVAVLLCAALPARAQYTTPTYNGLIVNGAMPIYAGEWSTSGRPSCNSTPPVPGSGASNTGFQGGFGFNTTTLSMEQCSGGSWIPMGGGSPGGVVGNVQTNAGGGSFAGITNAALVALVANGSGGSDATKYLNEAGTWTSPSGGTGCSVSAGCTYAGNVLFLAGAGGLYASNTGSPQVGSGQLGQGALEWNDPSWQPAAAIGGSAVYSTYDLLFLQSMGHSSGTLAQLWAGKMTMLYLEGEPQFTSGSPYGTSTAAGTSLNGIVIATHIPAGLNDGGGTGAIGGGGYPSNPYYFEWSTLTGLFEAASTGYYSEGIAQYSCDSVDCGAGSTGNKTRMTGFLAAIYKNYAGTNASNYEDVAFAADSLGTQQTTFAPNSVLRGLGGWLVGIDFSGVTNVPGFQFASLPNGTGSYSGVCCIIGNDATDLQFYVNPTTYPIQNISAVSVSFTVPLFMNYGGTVGAMPTLANVGGTLTGSICGSSTGGFYQVATANCFGGGGSFSITDGTHTVTGVTSLSVTGGTVGGTTPNATLTISGGGGVSSIANGGGLTFSASTGSVTASLNLNNSNTWTAEQLVEVSGGTGVTGFYTTNAAAILGVLNVGTSGTPSGASIYGAVGITASGTALVVTGAEAVSGLLHAQSYAEVDTALYLSTLTSTGPAIVGTGGGSPQTEIWTGGTADAVFNGLSVTVYVPLFLTSVPAATSGTKTACIVTATGEITTTTTTCPP